MLDALKQFQGTPLELFLILAGCFAALFMLMVFWQFVKVIRAEGLRDIFVSETTDRLSMTAFWSNIAYFTATCLFLVINIARVGNDDTEFTIMFWLIYLGTVGTNAVANRWLDVRYKGSSFSTNPNAGGNDSEQYNTPPVRRQPTGRATEG